MAWTKCPECPQKLNGYKRFHAHFKELHPLAFLDERLKVEDDSIRGLQGQIKRHEIIEEYYVQQRGRFVKGETSMAFWHRTDVWRTDEEEAVEG